MQYNYSKEIANVLSLKDAQVVNVLKLSSEGSTIPFIARYRKEMTGGLDEVQIEQILLVQKDKEVLVARKNYVLKAIKEQGKLSTDLEDKINNSRSLPELEDLYLPYKSSRKTRADKARDAGLNGLAKQIMSQHESNLSPLAQRYVKGVIKSESDALQGARDIIAEWINTNGWTRDKVRAMFERQAVITSKVVKSKQTDAEKFQNYFDWKEPLKRCPSHRYLAMLRGENESLLRVSVQVDKADAIDALKQRWVKGFNAASEQVGLALEDAYKRLVAPSIETEFRAKQKEKADKDAIKVFTNNLKQLLLQPPVGRKRTLAIDPGFRSGCKVVCLDEFGSLLHNETIFPHPPQKKTGPAMSKISQLVQSYKIDVIAIGNGTAGRETEHFIKRIKFDRKVLVYIVDESGASIYSASSVGRAEFPDYDVTVRGAVSIGRRLMDPLAELVKIDPKSIGVGQYQHDVDQPMLHQALDRTVESVVNAVGVDLNTASQYLLEHVSGLGPALAEQIVSYRGTIDGFKSRKQLLKVPRLGAKAFEQCAGFLRVKEGENPLDNSAVHPESYSVIKKICRSEKIELTDLIGNDAVLDKIELSKYVDDKIGMPTLQDIMTEIKKPGLDPRQYVGLLEFDKNVRDIGDLKVGMELPGLISNVTNFGAFVDIGIKENGLVHISELKDGYVSNPADVVNVYDKVKVRVVSVDIARKRIQLSMKGFE